MVLLFFIWRRKENIRFFNNWIVLPTTKECLPREKNALHSMTYSILKCFSLQELFSWYIDYQFLLVKRNKYFKWLSVLLKIFLSLEKVLIVQKNLLGLFHQPKYATTVQNLFIPRSVIQSVVTSSNSHYKNICNAFCISFIHIITCYCTAVPCFSLILRQK